MSLKAKLTSLIVAFLLLASLLVVGVFAGKQEKFHVGGDIAFNFEGINARIELVSLENGSLRDETDQVGKLETIEINDDMSKSEVKSQLLSWANLKMKFDTKKAEDVVMQLKITNIAETDADNYIDISSSADFTTAENCKISVANNDGGTLALLAPQDEATFTITFSVVNKSYGASLKGFYVDFNMQKKNLADIPTEVKGLTFDYVDEDEDALQVAWDGTGIVNVEIPAFVNYEGSILPVRMVAEGAFESCDTLESVAMPASVTSIGDWAFSECFNLANATIPASMTSIGSNVFGDTLIKDVFIPKGLTSMGSGAFSGCTSLESIIVEDGNEVYDSRDNCNAIIETATNTLVAGCKSTIISSSVTSIGSNAFYCCTNLESISLPNSVTSIGDCAFSSCTSLTSITLPEGVTSIGDWAFYYCTNLEGVIIPASVTSIGDSAFSGCEMLKTVIIISSEIIASQLDGVNNEDCGGILANATTVKVLTSIVTVGKLNSYVTENFPNVTTEGIYTVYSKPNPEDYPSSVTGLKFSYVDSNAKNALKVAWDKTTQITDVEIPAYLNYNGTVLPVTSIGDYAFNNCTSLESITIPDSVTSIASAAFNNCTSLESIIVEEGNRVYNSKNNCNAIIETDTNTLILGCANTVIPYGVTSIGDNSFYRCTSLANITIPDSVTSIGSSAFEGCTSLKNITIPESVTSIGEEAFCYCTSLTNITISDSVTSIGNYAFRDCTSLASITISGSVTSIGFHAFYKCTSLATIIIDSETIASQLDGIGESDCGRILANAITIKVPTSIVGSLNTYVKNNFTHTSTETIDGVEYTVYDKYLRSVMGLTFSYVNILMKNALKFAWDGTTTFTDTVEIPDYLNYNGTVLPVTTVGANAFQNCTSLASITIPNSVTSIGSSAFKGCTSLASIEIPSSVTKIGDSAFISCTGLTAIVIDSETIANALGGSDNATCGGILANATTVKILTSIATAGKLNSYVTENFTTVTTEGNYTVYSKPNLEDYPSSVTGLTFSYVDENTKDALQVAWDKITQITDVEIPAYLNYNGTVLPVTSLGINAFNACSSLNSIIIPEGVTSIDKYAFKNCSSLTNISIPNSLNFLAAALLNSDVFTGCNNLVYYEAENGNYLGNSINHFVVLVSVATTDITSFTIQDGCRIIKDKTFNQQKSLESVTVPESVTFIGDSAFLNCNSLVNISIPKGITYIGSQAFMQCSSLTTIVIPSGISIIKSFTFSGCTKLKNIIVESEAIASELSGTEYTVCGGILIKATTIKVLTSIVTAGKLNSYVTTNFTKVTTEGDYTVYSKA